MEENTVNTTVEQATDIPESEAAVPAETVSEDTAALREQIRLMEEKHAAEIRRLQIAHETKFALAKMGAKNPALTAKVLDMSAITVDDEGVHGLNEQLDKLRISDPYLFAGANDREKTVTGLSHGTAFADPENMTDAEYYRFVRRF